jgi:hypothetical protein
MSLKKYKFQGKAVEMTVNSKMENPQDFRLDFVKEFGIWSLPSKGAFLTVFFTLLFLNIL